MKIEWKTRSKTASGTLFVEPYRFLSSLQDRKMEMKKTLWDESLISISQGHYCCVKLVSVVSLVSGRDEGHSNLIFDRQGNRLLPGQPLSLQNSISLKNQRLEFPDPPHFLFIFLFRSKAEFDQN